MEAQVRSMPRVRVAAAITMALVAGFVQAQEEEQDDSTGMTGEFVKPWSNEAEVSFVKTGGNTETTTLAAANRFRYNWTFAEMVIGADILKASTNRRVLTAIDGQVFEERIGDDTAERYELSAKYRQNVLGDMFWFVAGGWMHDPFSGVDTRLMATGGVGYRFVENSRVLFAGEIGLGVTNENRTNDTSETFADGRAFAELRYVLSDTADLAIEGELLENLQNTDDLRLTVGVGLTAAMSDLFSMRIGYRLKYRGEPVVTVVQGTGAPGVFAFDKSDTTISGALVVKF